MDPETQRAEAERWLGIAAKLMAARDLIGSKTFAIRARDADPNNGVSEQILAIVDTVLAGEKRVNASQQPDWYSILQLPKLVRDPDLIADHYRRLVFCLNPERNSFPFADYALQLVMDAWSVLSDPTKKWLFDNELALFLQQPQHHEQHPPPPPQPPATGGGSGSSGGGGGGGQLNTFQFFQPQPQQLSQQQQQPQQQQQQPQQQQPMWRQQQQQQINQREFMTQVTQQQVPTQVTQQQVPPQWQMRDPTPSKGGGGGGGGGVRGVTQATPMIPTQTTAARTVPLPTQTTGVRTAPLPTQTTPTRTVPSSSPVPFARVTVAATTVVDGSAGNIPTTAAAAAAAPAPAPAVNEGNNDVNVNVNVNGVGNDVVDEDEAEEEEEEVVVEEVECFWTACPYCLHIFEYQKVYQDCTLRCQKCRKGFQAVQIPNPPPIISSKNGGGEGKEKEKKGKEKEENKGRENSFCCWGFFPLGFSMTAWKKHNQAGNLNRSSNWVPFSPMFASPASNGGGGFQWFDNNDDNACGPKNVVTKSTPRVYIDDDDEDLLELSEPSDYDSSDGDWRTHNPLDRSKKKKRRRRVNVGGRKRGRPPKGEPVKQVNQKVASGGAVSVGGESLEDGSNVQEVVFSLAAGDKSNSSKAVPASHMRKQTRRSVKDVGRLDLNVEFNNDGEEHAATVSAVNGEEDGIENIAFFEGLDEFLSTLPILNVGGDEKAKPS